MSSKVIIFGPTGSVASIAAKTAQENGAKVVLAMRDPNKTIPGLSSEQEKSGGYERVQADLMRPDTVSAAVKKSGAKSAFIYLAHGSQDFMKATIQALKDAGITFVVFLSSFTIPTSGHDVDKIPPSDMIPFFHAQVELNLESIYGSNDYVAVRPGAFATNVQWFQGFKEGNVKLFHPEARFDYITPLDMGRVSGTVLAKGRQEGGDKTPVLFGSENTSQQEAVQIISKIVGKDIKVTSIDLEEGVKMNESAGMPPPLARYLAERMDHVGGGTAASHPDLYKEGVANIEKYSGKPATGFKEWAESNKQFFQNLTSA